MGVEGVENWEKGNPRAKNKQNNGDGWMDGDGYPK